MQKPQKPRPTASNYASGVGSIMTNLQPSSSLSGGSSHSKLSVAKVTAVQPDETSEVPQDTFRDLKQIGRLVRDSDGVEARQEATRSQRIISRTSDSVPMSELGFETLLQQQTDSGSNGERKQTQQQQQQYRVTADEFPVLAAPSPPPLPPPPQPSLALSQSSGVAKAVSISRASQKKAQASPISADLRDILSSVRSSSKPFPRGPLTGKK